MKKVKKFIIASLIVFSLSLPVQAAESIPKRQNISNNEIMPRALLTTTVKKWSDTNCFSVTADIVTNDGTGKIIDIKNIKLGAYLSDAIDIQLSNGEIWNDGEYATVGIFYQYKGKIETDIVRFYPYGK